MAAADACAEAMVHKNMSLSDLLIMPIQRIPRYVLLLRELNKFTPEGHVDRDDLLRVSGIIASIANHINETKRQREALLRMAELDRNIIMPALPHFVRVDKRGRVGKGTLENDRLRGKREE